MNSWCRWWKFNLVGAMGMAVQLAALELLNDRLPGHYLYSSAAAVELALLHNFAWHTQFTWRDRRQDLKFFPQLARFQLSNGAVSVLGNIVLMRILVQGTHIPLLVSNLIAILCCSIANFLLGDSWAFANYT